jgi:hypothetical protein
MKSPSIYFCYSLNIVVLRADSNTYNPTTAFIVFSCIGLIAFVLIALCFYGGAKLKNKLWKKTDSSKDSVPNANNKPFVWLRTDNELIPLSDKARLEQIINKYHTLNTMNTMNMHLLHSLYSHLSSLLSQMTKYFSSLENVEQIPVKKKSPNHSSSNNMNTSPQSNRSSTNRNNNNNARDTRPQLTKEKIALGRKGSSEGLRRSPREKVVEADNSDNNNNKERRSSGSLVKAHIAKFEKVLEFHFAIQLLVCVLTLSYFLILS